MSAGLYLAATFRGSVPRALRLGHAYMGLSTSVYSLGPNQCSFDYLKQYPVSRRSIEGDAQVTSKLYRAPRKEDRPNWRETFFNKYGCAALIIAVAGVIASVCGTMSALIQNPTPPAILVAWIVSVLRLLGIGA